MNNLKIVGQAATFFGVVSAVFTVILVIVTYRIIQISYAASPPPVEYVVLSVLSNVFPYLFLAVASLVVAYVLRGFGKEIVETEEAPSTKAQPTEAVS